MTNRAGTRNNMSENEQTLLSEEKYGCSLMNTSEYEK